MDEEKAKKQNIICHNKKSKSSDIQNSKNNDDTEYVNIGGIDFEIQKIKGKKNIILPFDQLKYALNNEQDEGKLQQIGGLKVKIKMGHYELLNGEKAELAFKLVKRLDLSPVEENKWNRNKNLFLDNSPFAETDKTGGTESLIKNLDMILRVAIAKQKSKELGFICLLTDGRGTYWQKVSRGFATALNESLSSLETLIDEATGVLTEEQKLKLNSVYRKLNDLYD